MSYIDGLTRLFDSHTSKKGGQIIEGSRVLLQDARLETLEQVVRERIQATKAHTDVRALLVLDGLDVLLATSGTDAQSLIDMIAEWREVNASSFLILLRSNVEQHAYATIVTASVDHALLLSPSTPLEINHAAFVTSLAHQARFVMSLRLLSTGAAKDVSGVLRITIGPEADGESTIETQVEEKEVLYWIGGDGNVKVFEKGTEA